MNQAARAAWDEIAAWWDEKVGAEGNHFQRLLIGPAMEEPIFDQPVEPGRLFSWMNYREIPPVLVARMHLSR